VSEIHQAEAMSVEAAVPGYVLLQSCEMVIVFRLSCHCCAVCQVSMTSNDKKVEEFTDRLTHERLKLKDFDTAFKAVEAQHTQVLSGFNAW
jgi:hypothetical protein